MGEGLYLIVCLTIEVIEFFISSKFYTGPRVVLGYLTSIPNPLQGAQLFRYIKDFYMFTIFRNLGYFFAILWDNPVEKDNGENE